MNFGQKEKLKSKSGQAAVTQSCSIGVLQQTDGSQKCERVRKRREEREPGDEGEQKKKHYGAFTRLLKLIRFNAA